MRNGFWWLFLLFVVGLIIAAIFGFFNGLPWLAGQIWLCLILASLLGIFLGWLFGRLFGGGGWRTKFTDLESRFNRQSSDLDSVRSDLDARNLAFGDLETRFAGVQADLDASRLGRADLSNELSARTERMAELERKVLTIADKDAEIDRLNLRLGDWNKDKQRLAELESELGTLRADYDSRLSNLQAAEKRAADFETQLVSIRTQTGDKEKIIADLRANLDKAQTAKEHDLQLRIGEIEGMRNSLVERDRQIAMLEAQLSTASNDDRLAELESELDGVRNTINDRDARILDLEAQLASYRASSSKASNLEAQAAEYKRDLDLHSARVTELETELEGLKADLDASRQGRLDLQNELAARTEHIGQLETNLQDVRSSLTAKPDVSAELASLKADLDASRQGRADLQTELALRTERIGELESQVASLRSQSSSEAESIKADLAASRQGRSDLEAELAARTERIADLETKLVASTGASAQESQLRQDIERRNARIAELEKALNSQEKEGSGDLRAELNSLRLGLAERDTRIAGLESRLQSDAGQISGIRPSSFTESAPSQTSSSQRPSSQASSAQTLSGSSASGSSASGPASPRKKSKKKKEVIGYRVTNSRVFRADVAPEGYDPLGVIDGIGNSNQQKLWNAGIRTFKDLSETSEDRLKSIIGKDDAFYDEWIVESRRFVRGVYRLSEATSGGSTRRADDLTRIEGIGPKINEALLAGGIRTFEALEAASATQLRLAIEAAGITFAPSLENWSKQAAYLVRGDEEGFKAYTDYLIAGRDEGSQD
ncbi:MAG: hypothetical protein KC422_19620 [Trueperaceae bacterium]|nr:hypothetical protein [Trueperaceae bacterium]